LVVVQLLLLLTALVSGVAGVPSSARRELSSSSSSSSSDKPVLTIHHPATPGTAPSAAVIFLHGLGDTGEGWRTAATQLAKRLPHVKFLLPTAPSRPVALNRGRVMPAWYDIKALPTGDHDNDDDDDDDGDDDNGQDMDGIAASRDTVERLVAQEAAQHGIPRSRVVVGGFSQGAVVSMYTGLSNRGTSGNTDSSSSSNDGNGDHDSRTGGGELLAGVICLSGYLAGASSLSAWADPSAIASLPVLQCHGTADTVVPFLAAEEARRQLQAAGAGDNLRFEAFDGMRHR
jgi:predicted esterase